MRFSLDHPVERDDGLGSEVPRLRVLHIENLSQGDAAAYRSVGGFVLSHLSRIPDEGDHFEWGGFSFEVVDMDRHRIDKLAVARITPSIVVGESAVEETS